MIIIRSHTPTVPHTSAMFNIIIIFQHHNQQWFISTPSSTRSWLAWSSKYFFSLKITTTSIIIMIKNDDYHEKEDHDHHFDDPDQDDDDDPDQDHFNKCSPTSQLGRPSSGNFLPSNTLPPSSHHYIQLFFPIFTILERRKKHPNSSITKITIFFNLKTPMLSQMKLLEWP